MATSRGLADDPAHVYAIEVLAQELSWPEEAIREIYLTELARLMAGARVDDYLVVLTSRKVRDAIRRKANRGLLMDSLPDDASKRTGRVA
jgi:hypothetical protein